MIRSLFKQFRWCQGAQVSLEDSVPDADNPLGLCHLRFPPTPVRGGPFDFVKMWTYYVFFNRSIFRERELWNPGRLQNRIWIKDSNLLMGWSQMASGAFTFIVLHRRSFTNMMPQHFSSAASEKTLLGSVKRSQRALWLGGLIGWNIIPMYQGYGFHPCQGTYKNQPMNA